MIDVIRKEMEQRRDQLGGLEPDLAYDEWYFSVMPFIGELSLMLLVALRHQVERELVRMAACVNAGSLLTRAQFKERVKAERDALKRRGWNQLAEKLNLNSFPDWNMSMKALELVANSLKHNPWGEPDAELLRHLNLPAVEELRPPVVGYQPLADSHRVRSGLALYIDLPESSDYCTIAEKFAVIASEFLDDVAQQSNLSPVSREASLFEFAG